MQRQRLLHSIQSLKPMSHVLREDAERLEGGSSPATVVASSTTDASLAIETGMPQKVMLQSWPGRL